MHILEIPSFFPPLGGLFCLDQARALKARGHEVRIISCVQLGITVNRDFYWNAPLKRWWDTMEGVEVCHTYMRGVPRLVRYNMWRWVSIVKDMYKDYVRKYGKPDVIHAHCCKSAGIVASELSRQYGVPFFITEHIPSMILEKDFGTGWSRERWVRDLMKETYHKANLVIPVSQELVDDIEPFFGKDYRHKVVSNTIDTSFFAYRERTGRVGRPFRICCLAIADIERKGYDVLAKAWKEMPDMELHIAGRNTDNEAMKALFADCQNVTLYGHLEKKEVRELIYHCDALVLPSRSEAQPLVLLEAMATGIPVVSTEVVPMSERIPGACFIVDSGDAKSLHDALVDIKEVKPSEEFSKAVKDIAAPDTVARKLEELFTQYK